MKKRETIKLTLKKLKITKLNDPIKKAINGGGTESWGGDNCSEVLNCFSISPCEWDQKSKMLVCEDNDEDGFL